MATENVCFCRVEVAAVSHSIVLLREQLVQRSPLYWTDRHPALPADGSGDAARVFLERLRFLHARSIKTSAVPPHPERITAQGASSPPYGFAIPAGR